MTTGFGYYGNTDGNLPVNTIIELDNLEPRKNIGTDVFVFGFNGKASWEDNVVCEILDNFLMAIYKDKLSVSVHSKRIDSANLSGLMKEYKSSLKEAYSYYKVLSDPETQVFEMEFHGLGTLKLSVLVDHNEKLNRKVLVTRTSGMKLLTIGSISRLISFSGILEMQGEKLNEYFREMETPSHDKWIPARYTKNPSQAKMYHDELKQWVRDTILGLAEYSSEEEIEIEGLGSVLQKESDTLSEQGDNKKEELHNTIGNIVIQRREITKNDSKGSFHESQTQGELKEERLEEQLVPMVLPLLEV